MRPPGGRSPVERFCDAVDGLNEWMGRIWGTAILVVTFAVVYEVVARTFFAHATTWANETTIYLSAMAYLICGGYALRYRRHVRIDVVYQLFSPAARKRLDLVAFVFFAGYVGALVWVGTDMAWTSLQQSEGTGTPWNPRIWPVKMAIPIAAVLLLLQGTADLLRERGIGGARARL
ncbi:MAG: TRAP transporter small permease subunit [Burkholderiales bacterium]|nr:TRAP transporter small permease subunit [Burkholderiales bacterium]